jgi:hypothetical protein
MVTYKGDQMSHDAHILSNEAKIGNWWGGWKGGFKGPANFWGVHPTSTFPPQGNSKDYQDAVLGAHPALGRPCSAASSDVNWPKTNSALWCTGATNGRMTMIARLATSMNTSATFVNCRIPSELTELTQPVATRLTVPTQYKLLHNIFSACSKWPLFISLRLQKSTFIALQTLIPKSINPLSENPGGCYNPRSFSLIGFCHVRGRQEINRRVL